MESAWDDTFLSTFGSILELEGQHRQAEEGSLLGMLSRLRVGICLAEDHSTLKTSRMGDTEECTDFQHPRAKTCHAKEYNEKRLN